MNKILLSSLIASLCLSFFSCEKNNCISMSFAQNKGCIDSTLINSSVACIEIYNPVCGCNGVTYNNYCYADINGVTFFINGVCCD